MAGIDFVNPSDGAKAEIDDVNMIVADITFSAPPTVPAKDVFFGVVTAESYFICCPLPYHTLKSGDKTPGIYRISCGIPSWAGAPPNKPSNEYLQSLINAYGPMCMSSDPLNTSNPVRVTGAVWYTRYRTRSAVASRFHTQFGGNESGRKAGNVFLIGDAAHIHPPAGGQGMNLGVRDAVLLGPVLAAHIQNHTPWADRLLEEHAERRRARAIQIIGDTHLMADTVGLSPKLKDYSSWSPVDVYSARDWLLWAVGKSGQARSSLAYRFSGLGSV